MISAQEALKITEKRKPLSQILKVEKSIQIAAKAAFRNAWYDEELLPEALKILEDKGYKVNQSFDSIENSWTVGIQW